MKRINGFTIALLIFIIFILGRMYFTSDSFNLRCVISDVDGKQYCVRERKQLHKVADLLARVTNKMKEPDKPGKIILQMAATPQRIR